MASGSLSTLPGRYTTGTTLNFTCNAGYGPVGDTSVVTCDSLGAWQPYNPSCTSKCGAHGCSHIDTCVVGACDSVGACSVCTCDSIFGMRLVSQIFCLFLIHKPVHISCIRCCHTHMNTHTHTVVCPSLVSHPSYLHISTPINRPGTVVTFSCDPGYTLVGGPSVTCRGDGTWNRDIPQCQESKYIKLQLG